MSKNIRNKIQARIMRLPHAADLSLPAYQNAHAAGLDLMAAVPAGASPIIAPGGPGRHPHRPRNRAACGN